MIFARRRPEYRGYVDAFDGERLRGWAADRAHAEKRLALEIHVAGARIGSVVADLHRDDLARSGIGDGRHGFVFEGLPKGTISETIAVKVAGADFWLINEGTVAGDFLNAATRGLPVLRPGLTQASVSEADIEVAAELQKAWRAHAEIESSGAKSLGGVMTFGGAKSFGGAKTMWDGIVANRHGPLLRHLARGAPRDLATILVDIQKSLASEGLTQGEASYRDFLAASPEGRRAAVAPFHDMLASFAQYLAIERAECAEQDFEGAALALPSEVLVERIERALGHAIVPKTIFDGLFGLAIGGGVLHGRDIQALYAALRVIEASGLAAPSICEIGGGFGKVAHYAWERGARHYAIVDLPSVSAMQYFYLRRALPHVPVRFVHPAERPSEEGIDLLFATHVGPGVVVASDIVLNCDSFPEMGDAVCRDYFALIARWAPLLLSINQEGNRENRGPNDRQSVVGALLPDYGFTRLYRFRSWIRRGFVEELWRAPPLARDP